MAGVPNVEMHLYGNGRHPGDPLPDGSRMSGGLTDRNNIPYGTWQFRFIDWARDLGFLQKPGIETKAAKDVASYVANPPRPYGQGRGGAGRGGQPPAGRAPAAPGAAPPEPTRRARPRQLISHSTLRRASPSRYRRLDPFRADHPLEEPQLRSIANDFGHAPHALGGGWVAVSLLNLREIGRAHADQLGELPQADSFCRPLLADHRAEPFLCLGGHSLSHTREAGGPVRFVPVRPNPAGPGP